MGEGWGATGRPSPGVLAPPPRDAAPLRRRGWDVPRPFSTGATDPEGGLGGSDKGMGLSTALAGRSCGPTGEFGGPLMALGFPFSRKSSRWKGGSRGACGFWGGGCCDKVLVPVEVVVGRTEEEEDGTTQ